MAEAHAVDNSGFWQSRADKSVTLTERPGLEMVQISAWPKTSDEVSRILTQVLGVQFPMQPNIVAQSDLTQILSLGPHQWLVKRPIDSQAKLALEFLARLPSDIASIVEIGAGRCALRLSGDHSRDVLAKLLPIDLTRSHFPVGCCAQSAIAQIAVLVLAVDDDSFEIIVNRSFARHLSEVLEDATLEFLVVPRSSDY